MGWLRNLSLLLLLGCAFDPERHISSVEEPIVLGVADLAQSEVRYLPPETSEHDNQQLFLLSLRDSSGTAVDIDTYGLKILRNRLHLPHQIERISLGRYTLMLSSESLDDVVLKLDGKYFSLKQPRKSQPYLKQSSASITQNERSQFTLRILLKDKKGKPVLLEDLPEIIFDGADVHVRELNLVSTGVWEAKIQYPEENFILYVSIRANGVLLHNIYRYQHIEK